MSNRKPFNDCAGYVASKENALTNIHNVIYIASEAGIDADGKYVTVCEAHGQMVSNTSFRDARVDMKNASEWCSGCQAIQAYHDNMEARVAAQEQHWLEQRGLHRDDEQMFDPRPTIAEQDTTHYIW